MAHEHPRGAGPFVGHQLRYLVASAHGWLGGVGFAASARRLKARDAWVGWDDARRRAHLHRVVGLCRMLIRPDVACRNLASHVLGRAVRAVGEDFERLYGYRPWLLETFVDETEHTGASLRAANWARVGESCGRGRNDRTHDAPHPRKAVYVYALEPAWRERLARWRPARRRGTSSPAPRWAMPSERALGRECAPYTVADARHQRSTRGGQGTLPAIDQPADSAVSVEHTSRAHAATHGLGVHGAVCPGHHQLELHPARPNAGAGGDWLEPDRCAGPRSAPAHDACGQSRRGAAGGAAGRVDAPPPPDPDATGPKAREEKNVSLGRGAARLRPSRPADPRGVHHGPRGHFLDRSSNNARTARRAAGACEGQPRRRQRHHARGRQGRAAPL